ncbi:CHC2 zinc finger domain-containing protein [Providencia rettgeri]|nr:CHC2 zinc finger domain-containing protein [Providencia rettgeri]MDV5225169.1 CHC2 zinc finger domain-containing protein [Providencia rettgeri]
MARIADAELQHVKQAVSLVTVAQSQGRQLFKRGKDMVLLCPFHEEKTPSCVISPDKNLYHCFGCGVGGSVLDWVMKTESVSLRRAYESLRGRLGGDVVGGKAPPLLQSVADVACEASRQTLLSQVVEFYHHTLLAAPEAKAYLAKRGLHHPELVSHFKLGFANRTLAYRLPPKKLKAGALVRSQLQQLGVLRETGHEHFHGSLVVPVVGLDGIIGELYGRKISDGLKSGTPLHLYLPGAHRGVWNEAALVASRSIILCESLIDALSFWVAGQRHVTCTYGVNGLTTDHLDAFKRHGVKQVLIAFDNDVAGNDGAVRVASALSTVGLETWRVVFPSGMDANSYLCSVKEPEREFSLLLDGAQLMVQHGLEPLAMEAEEDETSVVPATEPVTSPSLAAGSLSGVVVERLDNGELLVGLGAHQWRVCGVGEAVRKGGGSTLKVNAQVLDKDSGVLFADSVDLLSSRSRHGYVRIASSELGLSEAVLRRELGQVLWVIEQQSAVKEEEKKETVKLSDEQRAEALALLQDPALVARIVEDLAACGVVGESTNLLAGYLAAVSRKLDRPLAVLIQSSSAAGKSSLMDAVLGLIPPEERLQYSAMTGQSLFYLGETNLQHKILAIAEEEGVRQAAYALKLLQSDGELTIASTGKDDATGNLVTKQYTVKGPVMLMLTTTAIDVDEELLNRCLVLTVNESREQTEAIHALQRHKQTLEGLLMVNERAYLTELHQNAQRLLRPLNVVNPFASELTFMSTKTRTRRDHMKYLTLIQSIALLHQHQRDIKQVAHRGNVIEYVEVMRSDIKLANQLAHEILGRTLDELPPQTRKLLLLIQQMVNGLCDERSCSVRELRFTRRDVREYTQWSDNQLKVHCLRLVDMEYLLVHGGSRGHLLQYELLWNGRDEHSATLCGLIDV